MSLKFASLQGLRGISICLVLIFHLFPKEFPRGFVGVDMFFVLSGFLMTKILSSDKSSTFEFYLKRVKRIVPIYYVTLIFLIISAVIFLLKDERTELIYNTIWAIPMLLNFQSIFEHTSYWDQISSIRYLTHFWSICVEFQYYLIAPLIHFGANHMKTSQEKRCYYLILIILSLVFQLTAIQELRYDCILSRIWQFLIGSLAYDLSKDYGSQKNNENHLKTKLVSIAMLNLSILIFYNPELFGEDLVRFIFTIFAFYICLNCESFNNNPILTSNPLIHLGNLSFSIYLVHWPIINLLKYIQFKDFDETNLSYLEFMTCLTLIYLVSTIFYHCFEVKFIRMDIQETKKTIGVLIITLITLLPVLAFKQSLIVHTLPSDIQKQIYLNFDREHQFKQLEVKNCDFSNDQIYCAQNSSGIGKLLVIGNSLSHRAFPLIQEFLNGNFSEIRLRARDGSAPLYDLYPPFTESCIQEAYDFKPDMIWVVQGANEVTFPREPYKSKLNKEYLDRTSQKILNLLQLANPKVVAIDLPFFIKDHRHLTFFGRSKLYRRESEEKFERVPINEVMTQITPTIERLRNLKCKNCIFNDIQGNLLQNNTKYFEFFDRENMVALSYDGAHLSNLAYRKYLRNEYMKTIEYFYQSI